MLGTTMPPNTSAGDVLVLTFLADTLYPSRVWLPPGKVLSLSLVSVLSPGIRRFDGLTWG